MSYKPKIHNTKEPKLLPRVSNILHESEEGHVRLIRALGGNLETGKCCCPAHDDSDPSLHISEGKDGKVLFYCHAGCSQEDVLAALKELGLSTRNSRFNKIEYDRAVEEAKDKRFFLAHRILRAARSAQGDVAPYFKARGIKRIPRNARLLPAKLAKRLTGRGYPALVLPIVGNDRLRGAHVTFLNKSRDANIPDENGKSLRRSFGLVKGNYIQLGPSKPDAVLLAAEGIEKTLAAKQLTGLPGISAISAKNMKEIDLPPCNGVIICGDNDKNGVGQRAAEEAAKRWAMTGRKIQIAIPKRHKDWDEALRDPDVDRNDLRRAILNAPEYNNLTPVASLSMRELIGRTYPPRKFLLKPWLTTTSLNMIDAPPGHGKTWLALSIGYAVASRQPLLGWQCDQRARVLYVDGELPGAELQDRIRLLGPMLPDEDFRLYAHAEFAARGAMMPDLGTEEGRAALDAEVEEHESELIILDSVSTLVMSGEDNAIEAWRAIQQWSLKHRARGRAVAYLHHHGRSGQPRGSSGREIVLDGRIKMKLDRDLSTDTETAFMLEFPKARGFFGADTANMIGFLSTEEGVVDWRKETVKSSNRERVKELLAAGWSPKDIAAELKLHKSRVSQIMKEDGLKPATTEEPKEAGKDGLGV